MVKGMTPDISQAACHLTSRLDQPANAALLATANSEYLFAATPVRSFAAVLRFDVQPSRTRRSEGVDRDTGLGHTGGFHGGDDVGRRVGAKRMR